ncbi:H-NS family nucleoid-associated regulatory protein [Niveibacterium sp.]|uniref:H-NS histone family protein n=1 Tax=Niveibacterium sp. TaxID=2017444 RepID=UPI0035AF6202
MIDISTLTPAELSRLAKSIEKEIAKRTDATKSKVLKAVAKLAKEAGLEVGDLLGRKPAPKRARKVAHDGAATTLTEKKAKKRARYQNPADPKQRWSGHGRRPAWVVAHQANGGQLEDLRIRRKVASEGA